MFMLGSPLKKSRAPGDHCWSFLHSIPQPSTKSLQTNTKLLSTHAVDKEVYSKVQEEEELKELVYFVLSTRGLDVIPQQVMQESLHSEHVTGQVKQHKAAGNHQQHSSCAELAPVLDQPLALVW